MGRLDDLLKDLNKKKKYNFVNIGQSVVKVSKIPFTSLRLNYMTYGGVPRGKITEFAGVESSGKTTTALDIVKNAQIIFNNEYEERSKESDNKLPRLKVLYVDCENTLDITWCKLLGVNTDDLIVMSPQSEYAEEIFQYIIDLCESGEIGLVVLDSLGVMISQQAFEKDIEQKTYGGIAASLTLFSKKMVMLCEKYKMTFIGINQVREDLNATYGNALITTGGRGWRHNCTLRLMFKKGKYLDSNNIELSNSKAENPQGNIVEVSIAKTKSCKPDRKLGYYILNYSKGVDVISDLIDLSIKQEIITQKGAWYYFYEEDGTISKWKDNELSFQGKQRLYSFIQNDQEFTKELWNNLSSLYI